MSTFDVAPWIEKFIGCVAVDPAMGYPGVYAVTALGLGSKADQCRLQNLVPSKGMPKPVSFWIANTFVYETAESKEMTIRLEKLKQLALGKKKIAGKVSTPVNKAVKKPAPRLTPEQKKVIKEAFYGRLYGEQSAFLVKGFA